MKKDKKPAQLEKLIEKKETRPSKEQQKGEPAYVIS